MKTILFLQDQAAPPTQLLQDVVLTKASIRETEAVAGCNCDRWGHPCPVCRCVEPDIVPKAETPVSSLLKW
jgi:hypothetical protein